MIDIIENYNILRSNLPKLLDLSGYRMDYIAEKAGISKNYFYTKKSKNSFAHEEFEKIIGIIWKDEFRDIMELEIMKHRAKKGTNLNAVAFKSKMGWK